MNHLNILGYRRLRNESIIILIMDKAEVRGISSVVSLVSVRFRTSRDETAITEIRDLRFADSVKMSVARTRRSRLAHLKLDTKLRAIAPNGRASSVSVKRS